MSRRAQLEPTAFAAADRCEALMCARPAFADGRCRARALAPVSPSRARGNRFASAASHAALCTCARVHGLERPRRSSLTTAQPLPPSTAIMRYIAAYLLLQLVRLRTRQSIADCRRAATPARAPATSRTCCRPSGELLEAVGRRCASSVRRAAGLPRTCELSYGTPLRLSDDAQSCADTSPASTPTRTVSRSSCLSLAAARTSSVSACLLACLTLVAS